MSYHGIEPGEEEEKEGQELLLAQQICNKSMWDDDLQHMSLLQLWQERHKTNSPETQIFGSNHVLVKQDHTTQIHNHHKGLLRMQRAG